MRLMIPQKLTKIVIIVVILLLSTVFIINLTKIFKNYPINNFKRKPEGNTQLYFSDHLNLPKQVEVGLPYSFEFTIQNLEYKQLTYTYEVIVNKNGVETVFGNEKFVLEHGQSITIPADFILEENFGRAKVIVRLTNKNQEINFWVEESL